MRGGFARCRLLFVVILLAFTMGCHHTGDTSEGISIHFIDVGQGDSILIQYGLRGILIDGGEQNAGVLQYLESVRVSELDYVIGSHPHSDHIGGLAAVMDALPVRNIMMPRVDSNTASYEKLLDAIKNKGLKIKLPVPGEKITVPVDLPAAKPGHMQAPGALSLIILAPNDTAYEDVNNYSIAVKLVYGKLSFLFTGDAEALSESEMLVHNLSADVLKVGHHGSNSSTSEAFLRAVAPRVAVISLGEGNMYGHPHPEVMDRLTGMGVRVYRTDEDGTVLLKTDGVTIYGR